MLASVLPLAGTFVMLFAPPDRVLDDQGQLFTWLLVSIILLRTALTVFMVPYLALGAEMSSDYHERTRLASARTNLGYFIGVLASALALMFLFGESNGEDGRFVIDNYRPYGWINAGLVVVFSAICIAGTWRCRWR